MGRMKRLENINQSELYPCPKCKGRKPDVMVWFIKGSVNRKNYAVVCPKCGYRLSEPYKFNTPEKAIARWNKEVGC